MSRTPTATGTIASVTTKLSWPREGSRITKTERMTIKTPTIPISPRTRQVDALQILPLQFLRSQRQVVQERRECLGSRSRTVGRLLQRFRVQRRLPLPSVYLPEPRRKISRFPHNPRLDIAHLLVNA